MQWIYKNKYIFISLIFSVVIYLLIPVIMRRCEFFTHFVIAHYISLLQKTILLLPVVVFLYNILPLRKWLDYEKYLFRIQEKHFLLIIFTLSLIATNLISYYLYDHIPQGDDIPAFYQAKIFAEGKRWVKPPVYPEFFIQEMVTHNGKWFSITPPGHSITLLLGMGLKIPWLICPLLGSLSLVIFYFLLKILFNPGTARTGAVFLLLSPTFLFISASMLTQNSSYFFLLSALLLTAISFKGCKQGVSPCCKRPFYQLLSGVCVGYAFISRPQLSIVFAIALFVFLFTQPGKGKNIFLFIVGIMPFIIAQLVDNYILTGTPFQYGYQIYTSPKYHELGFGLGKGAPTFNIAGHTPIKAIINLLYNGFVFSLHLFGWPLVSLIFIPAIVFSKAKTAWDKLAMWIIVGAIIWWAFYWFHGVSPEGPKYYYEIVPLLVWLTVRGIEEIKVNLRPLITLLFFITIFVYIPQASKVFSIWGTNLNCYNTVNEKNIHKAIVFVRNLPLPVESKHDGINQTQVIWTINRFNYPSVAFRNSPNIDESDIIYARDEGDLHNRRLKELYPDRKTYLFEYLSLHTWHLIEY